jgi:hypothetical protein
MFGWSEKPRRMESQLRIMRAMAKTGKSCIITRINWRHEPGQQKRIHLWWGGLQNNGDLMLLLAYLLSLNQEWQGTKIVINSIVKDEKEREILETSLSNLISETRIHAETRIIIKPSGKEIHEIIRLNSGLADIVFIGLKIPEPGSEGDYAKKLSAIAEGLSTVIFVRNAGEFAGNLI